MEYNEKQLKIIETAEKLFANNGFEGTSVRDIARESDINVAMVSYYFGSKEKLIEAIFAYRISITRLTLENILSKDHLSPIQKIDILIDNYIDKMLNNQCFYRLMMQEGYMREIHMISNMVQDAKIRNYEIVKKMIGEGQKAGVFRKNIDVQFIMATMIGTANHFMMYDKYYKKINNLENLSDDEFKKHLRKKLSTHLKALFKAYLTYEA
jgi:AcrR family transcriptional regulator